eukprot:13579087-Alexandrium_andersonii.AAC.1
MSASLVGSEMCIRDSCLLAPLFGLFACCCCLGAPSAHGGGTAACLKACPCLLYTSDAADDM